MSSKLESEVLMKGKKKKKLFSFKRLFKLALFFTLCYVVYDIYKHKSYGASKTGKFMKRNGIEDAAIEGYIATKGFCIEANSWVQSKYPVYYTKFREYSDPAMDFAAEKLTIVGTFVAEKTKPARDYLNEKVPLFIEKVEKELPIYTAVVRDHLYRVWKNYGPVVKHYLNKTWEFLQEYVPIVLARIRELFEYIANTIYDFAPDFFAKVAKGIEELGERISEKLPEVLSMIKEYAIIAINLAISGVSNAMAAIQEAINSSDSDDTAGPAVQPQAAAGTGKTVPK